MKLRSLTPDKQGLEPNELLIIDAGRQYRESDPGWDKRESDDELFYPQLSGDMMDGPSFHQCKDSIDSGRPPAIFSLATEGRLISLYFTPSRVRDAQAIAGEVAPGNGMGGDQAYPAIVMFRQNGRPWLVAPREIIDQSVEALDG